MYSLTEDVYSYYYQFITLLFNDGGMFSPPPENPQSNVVNLTTPLDAPLGFFQVSMLKSSTVIVSDTLDLL